MDLLKVRRVPRVIVDMTQVNYIDSASVACLDAASDTVGQRGSAHPQLYSRLSVGPHTGFVDERMPLLLELPVQAI